MARVLVLLSLAVGFLAMCVFIRSCLVVTFPKVGKMGRAGRVQEERRFRGFKFTSVRDRRPAALARCDIA